MKLLNKYWPFILITLLSGFIIWPLFLPGYFTHHDDLQVMRIFEMRKCFTDLQIPCRWVPDMGYGNGYPLFNYYNPLPYYIGGIFSYFVGFLISAKMLFLIPLLLGGISMYVFAKDLLGKEAGFLSAILYMFAPYRALDSYVRGAVAESFALAFFPLVLYFLKKGNLVLFSILLALFLTSHTIMTLLFLPVLIFFIGFWLYEKKINKKTVVLGLLLGFGLSVFFTLPAFFEKNLVQIENLARMELNFRAHFVTLPQLFLDRSWGYGASFAGPFDTISFQLGLPHWVLAFLSIPVVLFLKRKDRKLLFLYFGIFLIFLFSIFMTHNKSAFVWENIGILRFAQFPWRFLSVSIFSMSLLGGIFIASLNSKWGRGLVIILTLVTIFLNWSYFKPQKFFYEMSDEQKLTGVEWETQQKASILDYLPVGAVEPRERAADMPAVVTGEASISAFEKRSNSFTMEVDVKEKSQFELPLYNFPNWRVYDGGQLIKHVNGNIGRISFVLEKGSHKILGKFQDTPIRTFSNFVSLISMFVLIYLIYGKSRKISK